ncbi:MAG: phosphatase PAP2 family protein [candidate division KSB1 bacterium]|nr:phosphatase PAP2 family protein [candidate division KSB1 bacterium]MDZ7300670.1 phosphatase PAP2 family protein [candidate division KSB1 bacterium]MDZ7309806.1 phosphatase PAP2 family protein [candidate division KSB1 bacterium]
MTNTARDQHGEVPSDIRLILRRLAFPILATYIFLPLIYLVPVLDSTREPYFDLNARHALWAYGITETGGTIGAPIVGMLLLGLLVTRAGVSKKRRLIDAALIFGFAVILAGGGAALNEYVTKPFFKVPRPNLVYLAGTDGSGPLGMPVREFYAFDTETRRQHLSAVLEGTPPAVRLHPLIRAHWVESTGYSFPSGHAISAMFFATFFLAIGLSRLSRPRRRLLYLLLPWAVCVCYSRAILRVHTPMDIAVGGLEGLVLGVLAFVLTQASLTAVMHKISSEPKS